ncbi:hypothetical protein BKH46_09180 [Helicobacter sp. 12S02634-8]|nr:hypothetical protein BKH46_09180 [Helicobacter sp. 12S02634-8]
MRSPQFGWEGQNSPSNSPLPLPRLNTERQRPKANAEMQGGCLCSPSARVLKDRFKTTEVRTSKNELMRSKAYHNSIL